MSDRELLELAAKAAGHRLMHVWEYDDGSSWYGVINAGDGYGEDFDPLNEDGDALRLAVTLGLLKGHPALLHEFASTVFPGGAPQDPYAATRRAIVRAAAQIGKAMK